MKRNFVGQKVRRLRKQAGLTQADLAHRVGILQSDLCRMEKGEYKVSLDTLFRVLQVFGMDIAQFFGSPARAEAIEGEAELLARFRRLPGAARGEVMAYLRFAEQREARSGRATSP